MTKNCLLQQLLQLQNAMLFGNFGGRSPFANFAANLAEQSAKWKFNQGKTVFAIAKIAANFANSRLLPVIVLG